MKNAVSSDGFEDELLGNWRMDRISLRTFVKGNELGCGNCKHFSFFKLVNE